MESENLTAYQRGNRDGLMSFYAWALKMCEQTKEEAHKLELKACENGALERAGVRQSIISLRYKAQAYHEAAEKALRMSKSLPIDPQEQE